MQLADGRVMLSIRHEGEPHLRAISISDNGQTGWSPPRFPTATCRSRSARAASSGSVNRRTTRGPRPLFVNPHNPSGKTRKNLTVKLSYDEGETWPEAKAIESGPVSYSDLAVGRDDQIYCFFDRGAGKDRTRSLAKSQPGNG